jgi:hypothetical protein
MMLTLYSSTVATKLERSCYNYLKENYPDVLEAAEWTDPANCELHLATKLYLGFELKDTALVRLPKRRCIAALLRRVQNIRQAVVHSSKRIPIRLLEIMTSDGLELVEEFGDKATAAELRPMYQQQIEIVRDAVTHIKEVRKLIEDSEISHTEKLRMAKESKGWSTTERLSILTELRNGTGSQAKLCAYGYTVNVEDQSSLHQLALA